MNNTLQLTQKPVAQTGMLIRRPVAEVFEAFINPAITTQFWFTKSSGRLVAGQKFQWDWEMFGVSVAVMVKAIEPNQRLLIEFGERGEAEWIFTSYEDGTTFVSITNSGFVGTGDELVGQATDSTKGFTFVLAGLKALLEHNVRLNLIADHHPRIQAGSRA